jgi:hypothetical protein
MRIASSNDNYLRRCGAESSGNKQTILGQEGNEVKIRGLEKVFAGPFLAVIDFAGI